jgi:hypothetical protein
MWSMMIVVVLPSVQRGARVLERSEFSDVQTPGTAFDVPLKKDVPVRRLEWLTYFVVCVGFAGGDFRIATQLMVR